ncbi:type III-B CRISPR module-associated protein Cmr5 [Bacilliculturomica massiliensis]|uniref:type III-B CRISPR module-associated protein Cmr5 n=1 Tax=Bacilliculturomica massiliensis TaxID=1917867 RepID=UPI0010310F32|nr:type III-B CRISPR module-associated protein Cmr5 [Bacilliculturomica massiliensis]
MNNMKHNEMAEFAYTRLLELSPDKEFRSLARSFPSMIQINGLGAATAYLFSKKKGNSARGKDPHNKLYTLITEWAAHKFGTFDGEELTGRIMALNSPQYRIYTNEIMNLCLWIKRFAEGMVDGDGE